MSSEHTSRFLVPFLRWLMPDISRATIAQIHILLRKGAHLAEYAILAVLSLARASVCGASACAKSLAAGGERPRVGDCLCRDR